MRDTAVYWRFAAGLACLIAGTGAHAQSFMPPAGFSGSGDRPTVAPPADPTAPPIARLPDATLSDLFHIVPAYPRASHAAVKVVGAFAMTAPANVHLTEAWTPGYLPVALSFSDGRCFWFEADYFGGTLSNGRLSPTPCAVPRHLDEPAPPQPADRALRFIGSAWGYAAWADDRAGTTIVTASYAKTFEPLFTARMAVDFIRAMNGPDWPGGDITLIGRIHGRLTIVTLEVAY